MDTASMIDALQALGPHPDIAEDLMLFGQFVGAWDVDVTNIALDGTWNYLEIRAGDGRTARIQG
jgi:hypothetical protein